MIDRRSATSLLAVVGLAALLAGCGFGTPTGETRKETVSFDLGESTAARVELRMGAGELNVSSGTSETDGREVLVITSPIGSRWSITARAGRRRGS